MLQHTVPSLDRLSGQEPPSSHGSSISLCRFAAHASFCRSVASIMHMVVLDVYAAMLDIYTTPSLWHALQQSSEKSVVTKGAP